MTRKVFRNAKNNDPNFREDYPLIGTLGGEIDTELGFGTLEAATDSIMNKSLIWNQEELEMLREEAKKAKSARKKSNVFVIVQASQTSDTPKQKR